MRSPTVIRRVLVDIPIKLNVRKILPQSKNFYLIESGIVKEQAWNVDGNNVTTGYWGKGDTIGYPFYPFEIPLNLIACVDTSLLKIDLSEELLKEKIRQVNQFMLINSRTYLEDRVWDLLVLMASKIGTKTEDGICIDMHFTHPAIAEATRSTRVSVTKALASLEKKRKVKQINRRIIICK